MSILKVKLEPNQFENIRLNIPQRMMLSLQPQEKTIWAIGGGKGGIGKTILTANMAVYLSWLNKKVVVVDMDLGGANIHTSLGIEPTQKSLSDLVMGKVDDIRDIVQDTPIKNLRIISGAQDPLGVTNVQNVQKSKLLKQFRELDADYILLDLGAGTHSNTVDFFLLADKKIVVVTPEPTSIENAYRFIKAAYFRMLRACTPSAEIRQIIEDMLDQKSEKGIRTPKELLVEAQKISNEEGKQLETFMKSFELSLIINQVRVKAEGDIGKSMQLVCERYFGMKVNPVGYIPYDNSVWQSIRKRVPFLIDAPNSQAVTHLEEVIRNLVKTSKS